MTIALDPTVSASLDGADPRSVISRAFAVLAALDDTTSSVPLARLAERTGLPKGSLHRLCAQLVAQGAVERTNFGYRLGFRMFELGAQASSPRRLRDLALPFMSELHAATRCAVHLSVLVGPDIFVVNSVTGRAGLPFALAPGGRSCALSSASGKAMIAYATREVRARAIESADCTPDVLAELDRIAAGAAAKLWTGSSLQAIAVPVLDRNGYSIAALSACARDFPPRHGQVVDALRGAAAAIEQKLRESPGSAWHQSSSY
ncbi:IclR family transcriptional regulator [Rhodococcus sp. NPDC057529]|uniref:IclR family transcriptional regulator n=1 Tax=Rhodococcus sp. NPDC057529 TaxID=3346158 RepID=UPI003672EAFA